MKSSTPALYKIDPDAKSWVGLSVASRKMIQFVASSIAAGTSRPDLYVPTRWDGYVIIGARLAKDREIMEAAGR